MPAKSSAYREAVRALHASVSSLIAACEVVKQAEPQSQISAYWDDLVSLRRRVKFFVNKRWPRKVLNGLAGCYTDMASTITWIQSNTELAAKDQCSELDHLFVSLIHFHEAPSSR